MHTGTQTFTVAVCQLSSHLFNCRRRAYPAVRKGNREWHAVPLQGPGFFARAACGCSASGFRAAKQLGAPGLAWPQHGSLDGTKKILPDIVGRILFQQPVEAGRSLNQLLLRKGRVTSGNGNVLQCCPLVVS